MAKYSDLTMGQIEAIINKMGGLKFAQAYLRGEYQLNPVAQATGDTFDSAQYFVTHPGLYVWPEFTQQILPAYPGSIKKRGIKGVYFVDLSRNMCDREIVEEHLGGEKEARKHAFTPDQVADLIDAQPDGKSSELLSNVSANILYMTGVGGVLFPVYVRWHSSFSHWIVRVFRFEDGPWGAGRRLICNKR